MRKAEMITVMGMHDDDGEVSCMVVHQANKCITILQYDNDGIEISYEEARFLHRALGLMIAEIELAEQSKTKE